MKNFNKTFFSPLFLACICLACGSQDESGNEPNDNILKATPIELGKPVEMKIDSNHDRDWCQLAIPEKGYLVIGAKNTPGDVKPEIRFADKQPWESQKHQWYTSWSQLPRAIQLHEKDTVYFAIQDNNQNASASKSFQVKTKFHKEFDQHELNNKAANALEQQLGKTITSYIYPTGDLDWFKFQADSAGYLWAKTKFSPGDVKPEVKFAKRNSMTENLEELKGYCRTSCALRVPEKGTYHVKFQDNNNNASSLDSVLWKVDYLPEMDESEPNDEPSKAKKLSIPDTVSLAIFPTGDDEYFKLTPEKDLALMIKADPVDNIKPEIKLFVKKDLKNEEVAGFNRTPTKVSLKKGKTYFLLLQDDNASSPKPFKVLFMEGKAS